jgi:hypothetical protein
MKRIFTFVLFLCAFKASAIEPELRVRDSEIIVVAELGEIKNWDDEKYNVWSGLLTVKKSIWGSYKSGDQITFIWRHRRGLITSNDENYSYLRGKSRIWMLSFDDEGNLITGGNERVRELEEEAEIDRLLKAHPYFMKSQWKPHPENSPMKFTLKYRNAYEYPVKIPAFSFKNNRLILHSSYRINFEGRDIIKANFDTTEDSIEVAPRSEYSVVIPAREIGGFAKKGYNTVGLFVEQSSEQGEYVWKWLTGEGFYYIDYQ